MRLDVALVVSVALVLILAGAAAAQSPQPMNPVLPPSANPGRVANGAAPLGFPTLGPLSTSTWSGIGPAAVASLGGPGGTGSASGRIAGVAVDPTNSNNIYVAAAGGGVWQSTDGGSTWNPLTDSQSTLAMGAIAIAPSNHLKIYAGTGEANNSADSNFGRGILVSSDGGATWTLSTAPSGAFDRLAIAHISVDPTNANTAYAAVNDFAENGLRFANTGIYKTADGGTTWTNVTAPRGWDSAGSWSDVVVDPNTPSIIYAAHGESSGSFANAVYRSTDGGTFWSLLAGWPSGSTLGRIALAVAASVAGNHILYVAVANPTTGGLRLMLRSDNANAAAPTFTDLTSNTPDFLGGGNSSGQGWYDIVIGVDPSNSSNVYAAGVVTYGNPDTLGVIRSIDSGAHWTDITIVGGVEPHTDSHAMAFDSSSRLLLGNDGGVWRFDPTVPSWTNLNGNLNTIQFYGIGLHPTSTNIAVGGSQDNGTELYSGSALWSETDGGDGAFTQISQTNPMRMYASHPISSFGATRFFRRSDDGGNHWTAIPPTIVNSNNWNFVVSFVVDPTNEDHVILGGDQVYETTSGGATWNAIGQPGIGGFNPTGNPVDSAAVVPGTKTIYVATGGTFAPTSQIFVTTDDGSSWTARNLPLSLFGSRVNELDVDPNDATGQTVYAVSNRFNAPNGVVYQSTNGGASWTNISSDLPQIPAWSLKVDTDTSHTVYVSNETGVYSSSIPYITWTPYGAGLPHAQAVDLELVRSQTPHLLGVATHGRGAWLIQIANRVAAVTLSMASVAFGNLDVGSTSATTNVQLTSSGSATLTVASITLSGTNASQFALVAPTSGSPACAFVASSITAGNSCFFGIQAKPTAGGALNANVSVADDATGSPQTIVLTASGADIAVSGPAAAVTVVAGQSASFTISLNALGASTLNVTTFSATGNPAATTVTFNPPSIPAGSTSASTTMTIATTPSSSILPPSPRSRPQLPLAPYLIAWFALGLTALLLKSRRVLQGRLVGASLLILTTLTFAALAGCTGGGHAAGAPGTPAGTSTITVTATSGSLSRNTMVILTVQ